MAVLVAAGLGTGKISWLLAHRAPEGINGDDSFDVKYKLQWNQDA